MQDDQLARDPGPRTQIRGAALIAASAVGGVMVLGALWAAKVDLDSELERNSLPLEALAAGYKLLVTGCLFVVARRLGSRSLRLLAALMAALAAGSFLINLDLFDYVALRATSLVPGSPPVSSGSLGLILSFMALVVLAGWLLAASFRRARPEERKTVVTLIALFLALGTFVGPVNAISALGINREWLFAEDFGQVMTLAVLGGYSAGLVSVTSQ